LSSFCVTPPKLAQSDLTGTFPQGCGKLQFIDKTVRNCSNG